MWGTWGTWTACSVTCGGGTRTRTKLCDNPAPANGGADCAGDTNSDNTEDETDLTPCETQDCKLFRKFTIVVMLLYFFYLGPCGKCGVETTNRIVGGSQVNPVRYMFFKISI